MADSMADVLFSGARIDSFTVEILDRSDVPLGRLENVTGGTLTASVDARIKTAGTIDLVADKPIDWWADKRLKIWADANGVVFSLGVFLPSSPVMNIEGGRVRFSAALSDKLLLLDQDAIGEPLSLATGTQLDPWLDGFITDAASTYVYIHPSGKTLAHPMSWDAGTSKLTIVNDLLDYMGYFSLEATPEGTFKAVPYVEPKDRPISWQMRAGDGAWVEKSYTHEQDWGSVPNKVIYIVQSASAVVGGVSVEGVYTQPMAAVATNTNPDSWASYQRRGRWVTEVKTDVEAESQEELQKKAQRRLENAMEPYEKLDVKNLLAPIRLNELVRFTSADYDIVGAVRKTEISLTSGQLMKVTIAKSNYEIK